MGLSWKSLVSKIHPPLPMSPRESQRLLSLLNTSFKQQLDRYHHASSEQDAGLHLRSILSNPLFEAKPSSGAWIHADGRRKSKSALSVLRTLVKRPREIFKEQIAAGTATLDMAKLCLRAEHRNCLGSPNAQLGDALSSSGIGSLVLEWLWASGLENSKAFLTNWDFVRHLVPFVVAEQKQDRMWGWVQRRRTISRGTSLPGLDTHATKDWSNLLLQIISAENTYGRGLDSATNMFIGSMDDSQHGGTGHQRLHNAAGWYLTIALGNAQKTVQTDWTMVQRFTKAVKTFSRPSSLIVAYHSVYLAKDPNPDVALNYLRGFSPDHRFPKSKTTGVVSLGLKAAEMFLEKGRNCEALWLMEYLQTNFRSEIGAHASPEQLPSVESSFAEENKSLEEEETLRSLDTLAIQ